MSMLGHDPHLDRDLTGPPGLDRGRRPGGGALIVLLVVAAVVAGLVLLGALTGGGGSDADPVAPTPAEAEAGVDGATPVDP